MMDCLNETILERLEIFSLIELVLCLAPESFVKFVDRLGIVRLFD